MAYGKGLATDFNVILAIDSLPVSYSEAKQEFHLNADAFTEPLHGHVLKLMERLGLPADHPVITVLFENGVQKAVYQPVCVGKDGKLFLKVVNTLLPITLDPVKGFIINGKAVLLKAGLTKNTRPFLGLQLTFKELSGLVLFDFGTIFNESAVEEQLSTDIQGGQLLRTLQGFIAAYDPEEGRIIPPTEEDFKDACALLFQWGGVQGNILRMGHLNQILDEYENPLESPMVFWVEGAKLQQPKPGSDYSPQFLIWGSFSKEVREGFPELENVTCLSFNQPSEKSRNWQAWSVLKMFAERGELAGSAIKIVAVSSPANWCPQIAFFNGAKVEAICKELAANPHKMNVLGLTRSQIELYSGSLNLIQKLAAKNAAPVPDSVDWEAPKADSKMLAQAATQIVDELKQVTTPDELAAIAEYISTPDPAYFAGRVEKPSKGTAKETPSEFAQQEMYDLDAPATAPSWQNDEDLDKLF